MKLFMSRTRLYKGNVVSTFIGVGLVLKRKNGIRNCFFVTIATTESDLCGIFSPWEYCPGISIFMCMKARKSSLGMEEKNSEKPKINSYLLTLLYISW